MRAPGVESASSEKTRIRRRFIRFGRRENGAVTVEAVLWLPVFFACFGLMVDAAMIFNGQSRVLRIIQDANRNRSVGRLEDAEETRAYIVTRLNDFTSGAVVNVTEPAGVSHATVEVAASDLDMFGTFTALRNLTVKVTSEQFIEN